MRLLLDVIAAGCGGAFCPVVHKLTLCNCGKWAAAQGAHPAVQVDVLDGLGMFWVALHRKQAPVNSLCAQNLAAYMVSLDKPLGQPLQVQQSVVCGVCAAPAASDQTFDCFHGGSLFT